MTKYIIAITGALVLCLAAVADMNLAQQRGQTETASTAMSSEAQLAFIDKHCTYCHNDVDSSGDMSLTDLDLEHPDQGAELAEKVIRKLRAGMMPPPTEPRPDAVALESFIVSLETGLDRLAAGRPTPGERTLQRLNRAEYARSVLELLDLEIDVAALLPPDSMGGGGFDNMSDALTLSPALMEGYVRASSKISRAAVGDRNAVPSVETYGVARTSSQMRHVEGAPFGTRGGVSVIHNFPADGEYVFKMEFYPTPTGSLFGSKSEDEQIEVSIDGDRVALLDIDPRVSESRDGGVFVQTEPIAIKAGPYRVSAAFIRHFMGPIDDLLRPIEHTIADSQISAGDGITTVPHLQALGVSGPHNPTGVSVTPSRNKIFTCRPTLPREEQPCATKIVTALASQAYRRPASPEDLEGLMIFYRTGREKGDFESGIRSALQAVLTSPNFVFRFEQEPAEAAPGQSYRISDIELASRLSYFLWSTVPDDGLLALADEGRLQDPFVLEQQVRRMLADPRAESLSTRFASQWLRLQDLEGRVPDPLLFPQFDTTLGQSMRRETELLFDTIVREDRSVLDLLTADYTFVDERLANHYDIPNITGNRFRRVGVPQDERKGILGHGSILTLTSIADRTSPVARGKYVMEVVLGSPPPAPPPNVPELEETEATDGDKLLTLRERMETHRSNPFCSGCHRMIDPIGLALENFDATGKWRELDAGATIDPSGEMSDGTRLDGPSSLRQAILGKSDAFLRKFTESLMTYGLGRRVAYYDMPTVRAIARNAARNDNRFFSFAMGIVNSPAFLMRTVQESTDAQADAQP